MSNLLVVTKFDFGDLQQNPVTSADRFSLLHDLTRSSSSRCSECQVIPREMANYAKLITSITECPICLDDFTNPRSLPCLHSFCLKCLETNYITNSPGQKVKCSVCRCETVIPENGVIGFQHNFFLDGLISAKRASEKQGLTEQCEVCLQHTGDDSSASQATTYCMDCRQKLCERCSRPHKAWRGGAHNVVALGEEVKLELLKLCSTYCDQHPDEVLKMYCQECGTNICMMCFAIKHRKHECLEIGEVSKEFSKQMQADVELIRARINEIQSRSCELETSKTNFIAHISVLETDIKQKGQELKTKIDNEVKVILHELEAAKTEFNKEICNLRENFELALVALESFNNYSMEVKSKGAPSDITHTANELHSRAVELLGSHVSTVEYTIPEVVFKSTPSVCSLVGTLFLTRSAAGSSKSSLPYSSVAIQPGIRPAFIEANTHLCMPLYPTSHGNPETVISPLPTVAPNILPYYGYGSLQYPYQYRAPGLPTPSRQTKKSD